jgi:hypothetical protein
MDDPLSPPDARTRLRLILAEGILTTTQHARDEMRKDELTIIDCANVLRGGVVEPAEWESGGWRYRVHTARIWVVVEFEGDMEAVIVTAWRHRGKGAS